MAFGVVMVVEWDGLVSISLVVLNGMHAEWRGWGGFAKSEQCFRLTQHGQASSVLIFPHDHISRWEYHV